MEGTLAEVKTELKQWESVFARQNEGKKPGKGDIAQAPKQVQVGSLIPIALPPKLVFKGLHVPSRVSTTLSSIRIVLRTA